MLDAVREGWEGAGVEGGKSQGVDSLSAGGVVVRESSRVAGDAGHVRYDVTVQASDGSTQHMTFTGNIFGGSVMLRTDSGDGVWSADVIEDPRRYGEFASPDWVGCYLSRHEAPLLVPDELRRSG